LGYVVYLVVVLTLMAVVVAVFSHNEWISHHIVLLSQGRSDVGINGLSPSLTVRFLFLLPAF